jgi:hypothetical protein
MCLNKQNQVLIFYIYINLTQATVTKLFKCFQKEKKKQTRKF